MVREGHGRPGWLAAAGAHQSHRRPVSTPAGHLFCLPSPATPTHAPTTRCSATPRCALCQVARRPAHQRGPGPLHPGDPGERPRPGTLCPDRAGGWRCLRGAGGFRLAVHPAPATWHTSMFLHLLPLLPLPPPHHPHTTHPAREKPGPGAMVAVLASAAQYTVWRCGGPLPAAVAPSGRVPPVPANGVAPCPACPDPCL